MNHWITLISISILVIVIVTLTRNKKETFVNMVLKKELGHETCNTLWSDELDPANKVTASSYLNSKRISKWKGDTRDKNSCYMLDDIRNREQDPQLATRNCDDIFADVSFINNARNQQSEQSTTVVQANACVFDIDPNKVTTKELNRFWSSNIAVHDECIQANAYIIKLFEELTKEKKGAIALLAALKSENAQLTSSKLSLLSDIQALGSNIAMSNVVLNNLLVTNEAYTNELIKLRNTFGQNRTDYFNKSNVCIAYLKSCNIFVKQIDATTKNLDYQIGESVQKYTELNTIYTNLTNEFNSYKNSKEKLDANLTVLFAENEQNKRDYQKVLSDLGTCRGNLSIVDKKTESLTAEYNNYDKNNTNVVASLSKCKVNLADCQKKNESCISACTNLTNSITYYNNKISEFNNLINQCQSRNAELAQTMSNMNSYFDWVRSVYIYLSCDGLDLALKKNEQSLDLLQTQCKDADNHIANTVLNVANAYVQSQNNSTKDLQVCEKDVNNIRNDINKKLFPENIFISGDLRLACGPGEICPARDSIEALNIGQTVCSSEIPGSLYTQKWINYDGQRGAIYCSYYGDSKQAALASGSNKKFTREAGNVLPAGTYSNSLTNCTATNYNLSCKGIKNSFNFKNCASNVNLNFEPNNERLSCRPDGYDYLVKKIAICDVGSNCTFSNPENVTSTDNNELNEICKRYIKEGTELQASGDTIALHDGRNGAYCTYWGTKDMQTSAVSYNRNVEKNAYNIYLKS